MIGEEFKARREALGMDQKTLAERLYVDQSIISRIEAGRKAPSVALVRQAAELFNCTTDELIFGREGRSA